MAEERNAAFGVSVAMQVGRVVKSFGTAHHRRVGSIELDMLKLHKRTHRGIETLRSAQGDRSGTARGRLHKRTHQVVENKGFSKTKPLRCMKAVLL